MNKKKKIAWGVRISSVGLATGILSYMLYANDYADGTQQQAIYSSYPNSGENNNNYSSGNTPDSNFGENNNDYSSGNTSDFGSQNKQSGVHGAPNQNSDFDTTTGGT